MKEQVDIKSTDNRDPHTTWLWINDRQYVEVNPIELVYNVIENLPEEEQPELTKLIEELDKLLNKG